MNQRVFGQDFVGFAPCSDVDGVDGVPVFDHLGDGDAFPFSGYGYVDVVHFLDSGGVAHSLVAYHFHRRFQLEETGFRVAPPELQQVVVEAHLELLRQELVVNLECQLELHLEQGVEVYLETLHQELVVNLEILRRELVVTLERQLGLHLGQGVEVNLRRRQKVASWNQPG